MFGVEGGSAFLECEPRSLQARVEWTFQRAGEAAYTQVSLPSLPSQPGPCSDSYDQEVRALINEALGLLRTSRCDPALPSESPPNQTPNAQFGPLPALRILVRPHSSN